MSRPKPVVLCILDGWGERAETEGNAPALAYTPNLDKVFTTCPKSTLITFGPDVGLPSGQMGNSEVGHTNIGAGRVVAMDLGQIDLAIEDGSFFKNEAILAFIDKLKTSGGRAHLMGVISDGGVHGHIEHVLAACKMIAGAGVPVIVHAITDGRDVPPDSAAGFIDDFVARLPEGCTIGTVIGRYWAMDRDNRWERVGKAYAAMVEAKGHTAATPAEAVAKSYAEKVMDEFIEPTVIDGYTGTRDGDGFFCLNFRADRAREILRALGEPGFHEIDVSARPHWAEMLGMVEYSVSHNEYMQTAYPKRDLVNTIGEWVSKQGLTQFHCAETEKYPHVTFFLNGGREAPWPGEERFMPKSPKVATYDLQPEMSAPEVTEHFIGAIEKGYDLIVINYANPDMVGHTGSLPAAIKACEEIDRDMGRVIATLHKVGGAMIVTADHGNCETMIDPVTKKPHTAHTTNLVPVALVGGPEGVSLRKGRLADLAPTLLDLMELPVPPEMTGKTRIVR